MAVTKVAGRQWPLVAYFAFDYTTFNGTATTPGDAFIDVPAGAIVTGGALVVTTAFDTGTTDVIDFGDSGDDDRYTASAVSLKTAARTALTLTGYKYTAPTSITALRAAVGTAATAGAGYVEVQYIIADRATEAS